ncbi:MAG: hypothetical protein ABJC79_00400 [Acidimicrobiia bacterium]
MIDSATRPADEFTDEELTELALSADPDATAPDAIPIHEFLGASGESTLPEWYMPAVMRGIPRVHGWRRGVIFTFIAALVIIEAFGLCSTYGQII